MRKQYSTSLQHNIIKKLKLMAVEEDRTANAVIEDALKKYLEESVKMLNYKEMGNKFGITEYKGKEFALTENAKHTGGEKRIDNSIYVIEVSYNSNCIDKEGNEYIAYFKVIDENLDLEDESYACDWKEADYVELI